MSLFDIQFIISQNGNVCCKESIIADDEEMTVIDYIAHYLSCDLGLEQYKHGTDIQINIRNE